MPHRACRFPARHAGHEEALVKDPFKERAPERRTDPILATLVDVAIAYRENLGARVAQAFLLETGVPDALAKRVLDGSASVRAAVPRRRTRRALRDEDGERT
jgi:hypothetical protein